MNVATAGALMSTIISDTLFRSSPTTTALDKMTLSCLAKQSNTDDIDAVADAMFKAKVESINDYDDDEVVRADTKVFNLCGNPLYWATVETTDLASIMAREEALATSMKRLKSEKKANYAFLSIVDLISLNTDLILIRGGGGTRPK